MITNTDEYTGFSEDETDEVESSENGEVDNQRYPKFRIVYQTTNYHLPQIDDLLNSGNIINIRPEYQRRLRWDNKKKSALIESFLLNIPIPPVFFYESDFAQYEVMDGQQRLNCIREFYQNGFKLTGLTQLSELNGSQKKDLDEKVLRTLNRASISAIVLLAESAENPQQSSTIRKEVFERLNTGGQKLNPQEIRNAIYPGHFNEMVIELTRDNRFTKVWGIPPYTQSERGDYYGNPKRQKNALYKTMGDCQIVLRFFALLDPEKIRGAMQKVLNQFAKEAASFDKTKCESLKQKYLKCLEAAVNIRGEEPFDVISGGAKSRRSVPFQDAFLCALGRMDDATLQRVKDNSSLVKSALASLMTGDDDYELLIGRGNTSETIKQRISKVHDTIIAALP